MLGIGRSSLLFLMFPATLCSISCNRGDSVSERLKRNIKDLRSIHTDDPQEDIANKQILAGLQKLYAEGLPGPRLLYAARVHRKKILLLHLEYADISPRVSFFRIYTDTQTPLDLPLPHEDKEYTDTFCTGGVLYSALLRFDPGKPPAFWQAQNVFIEIHNTTGQISPRFPVAGILKADETTTRIKGDVADHLGKQRPG